MGGGWGGFDGEAERGTGSLGLCGNQLGWGWDKILGTGELA